MKPWLALVLVGIAFGAAAQTTYRWVDKDGKVHFSDIPPLPGQAKSVTTRGQRATDADTNGPQSFEARQAAENFPVTLFTNPDCKDPCREGREHLVKRGTPYTEKSVASEQEVAELRTLLGGGEPSVPVLKVGSQVTRGFLGSQWDGLLDAAGYPKAAAKPGTRP